MVLERTETRLARRRLAKRPHTLAGSRPDPTKDRGTDCLPEIRHVVVLMMENHSYDNYFGLLAGRGDGLSVGADGQPTETNQTKDGSPVPLTRFLGTRQVP